MVTTPRLTYQDYADLEGDERYEILEGDLILVDSPSTAHQTASLRLASRVMPSPVLIRFRVPSVRRSR